MSITNMRPTTTRRLAMLAVTAALLALAGCGGNEHGSGHTPTSTPPASPASGATFNAADVKFATEMIPHHRQAIAMAEVAETRASSMEVKTLAEAIRKAQVPEIATMSSWLAAWGQPVPTAGAHGGGHGGMPGMMSDDEMRQLQGATGRAFDRMFLEMMIRHHEGAVHMANVEQREGINPDAKALAAQVATSQTAEITQMRGLRGKV
jgi:uncharacterized protein (DUF305 family)